MYGIGWADSFRNIDGSFAGAQSWGSARTPGTAKTAVSDGQEYSSEDESIATPPFIRTREVVMGHSLSLRLRFQRLLRCAAFASTASEAENCTAMFRDYTITLWLLKLGA